MLTLSQVGTLLLYPVAKIIESNSFSCPFINLAPFLVISFTFSTTCNLPIPLAKTVQWKKNPVIPFLVLVLKKWSTFILPDLICDSAPTSRTGVFPVADLSSSGPVLGRRRPNCSVLPRVKLATSKRILSTSFTGSHLRSVIPIWKVEKPNISLGKTCTCNVYDKTRLTFYPGWQKKAKRWQLKV